MNIFINNRYRKIYNIDKTLFYVIYKKEKVNITEYFKKNGVIKKKYNHLIQQKSKMFGGVDNTLVVCSFNVFTWATWYDYPHTFEKKFKELIDKNKVELLLTQEDNIKDIDKNESVKAYSIGIEKSSRFNFISCIKTSPLLKGALQRNAIFIEDKKFGIKIANLHLEGGRLIDLELDDTTFQTYLDTKLALLKELLELKLPPDIILGDFNSVYCNDKTLLEQMYNGQKTYYDGRGDYQHAKEEEEDTNKKDKKSLLQHISSTYGLQLIERCPNSDTIVVSGDKKEVSGGKKEVSGGKKVVSLDHIKSWNNAPFELLQNKGYIYIEPENIIVDNKINPTNSRGKNVIDHVWVKETMHKKFTFKTKIYDGFGDAASNLYGMVSDHKPIILTITEKEEVAEEVVKEGAEKVVKVVKVVKEGAEKEEKVVKVKKDKKRSIVNPKSNCGRSCRSKKEA
jgi:hypothetical protein